MTKLNILQNLLKYVYKKKNREMIRNQLKCIFSLKEM